MTMLALDTYGNTNAQAVEKLGIDEIEANNTIKPIAQMQSKLLQAGIWSGAATHLRFSNGSTLPAWYVASQGGYDRDAPAKAIKSGLEIVRDYTDAQGNAINKIKVGDEIYVHVKVRATGDKGIGNIAIVDLLPGGFDPDNALPPVPNQSSDAGDDSANAPPQIPSILLGSSTWRPTYADVREDRVVIYGTAMPDVKEFVYRIKASTVGKFIVPPAYGESMYDRRVQARAPGGDVLTVVRAD